ncbi:MAG: molybdopterin-synthase adenylyltransferase MoeB [Candidatus Thiosymbion ectosymbiont of Robbea hypermnestra]|nr:molybdopterin-synthase adenylyltransferase MoeB [Candidatus Thiosymbion ectosymbiont of Robbea hypermnestra]
MNDDQLLRYSRQIMLPTVGVEGQERLLAARVLVVGLGGLGSPVALYLAAAGVGTLVVADFDAVELSNLQRQILHTSERLGMSKVDSAQRALRAINPRVRIEGFEGRIDADTLPALLAGADAVVDGCDNFATRFAVNEACFRAGVPLISGAAIRTEGQVAVFPGRPGGPCYQCLYPRDGVADETCTATGVLGPVVGIVGSIQATETLKLLTGAGDPLCGRLLLLDALTMEFRGLRLTADPHCSLCGVRPSASQSSRVD